MGQGINTCSNRCNNFKKFSEELLLAGDVILEKTFGGTELHTWRWCEVGDSSQSFSSDTLQGISSEWSGDTAELVYTQKRRDLIG